ncbi:unnamed protein product [Lactuca virosa]|uniref:Uncharacterized protein n=1 Tax=Lactuca virosa TaxID=75947 RepID=A0AAU9NFC8_9ASTR|nr:unnamed protein product [Lactuca virosa]
MTERPAPLQKPAPRVVVPKGSKSQAQLNAPQDDLSQSPMFSQPPLVGHRKQQPKPSQQINAANNRRSSPTVPISLTHDANGTTPPPPADRCHPYRTTCNRRLLSMATQQPSEIDELVS